MSRTKKNAGLVITYRPVTELIPYARNARTHTDAQVAQIAASVHEFGWTNPVLIDEAGQLIAGHGRLLAARKLGMIEVPTITLAGLSEAQKRALVLADNKLALNAGWDDDLLRVELQDLDAEGFDLGLTGFSADEIALLLIDQTDGLTDPDDVPETPADPVTESGDVWALFPGDAAYVWCASLHNHEVAESLIASGFGLRSQIIWAKSNFAISRSDYHWQHEPCWYAVRNGRKGHWAGDRKQTTLWQIPKPAKSETGHSTQKPVECMKRPIENNSSPGQAVYEPFSGSGTTIIAGEMTGRSVHAIELSPAYVDVAVLRWQAFTGQQATLDGDGRTFGEIAAVRPKAA